MAEFTSIVDTMLVLRYISISLKSIAFRLRGVKVKAPFASSIYPNSGRHRLAIGF